MASRDPRAFTAPENGTFAHVPPAPRRHDGPPVASLSSALGGEDRARAVDLTTLVTALPTEDELASTHNTVAPPRPGLGLEHHRQSPTRRGASRGAGLSTSLSGHPSPVARDANPHNQHSNVYVKNLSEDMDEPALKAAFERFGTVESCCVIRDVSTNASRGFGFVKFATVRQAASAIGAMHGAHVRGRALEVKFANADATTNGTGPGANGVGTVSDNVYVKGLPPRWSERELRDFFKAFGAIVECRLLHASGTTTAGALIRFAAVEQAIAAVVHANNVTPTPGGAPLVMRFADSHGKARRGERSGKDSAGNSRGGSLSGGSGIEELGGNGFGLPGVLLAQRNAASLAMLQHQLMQSQHMAVTGGSLGSMSASGSQHVGLAMRATGPGPSPGVAAGLRHRESFHGAIDEGSAHDGSSVNGTHGTFAGLRPSPGFGAPPGTAPPPPPRGAGGGSGGWVGPSSSRGAGSPSSDARETGGLGGLSAMFAGGADAAAERRAASSGSLGAWSHGSANSLGSRGSSVRGGNAFGPGSALSAAVGDAASRQNASANPPRSPRVEPYAPVSPVGSFDGGGLWARSPSLGGADAVTVPGATGELFARPADPADRAETPGISAEAARDLLDRLEAPDDAEAEASTEARRTLLVRGAPDTSTDAAELYLYRAFAPHGAVVSVRSTGTPGVAEHVVTFRRAAEADAARRALGGGALGALRVTALDTDSGAAQ